MQICYLCVAAICVFDSGRGRGFVSIRGRGGGGRGRMRGFGRRGRGGRGGASQTPTKDELDAQLDAYNAKVSPSVPSGKWVLA